MSIHFIKIQKIFDVRWVFSSFNAVRALVRDLPALYHHFIHCSSAESGRTTKDRSKYSGLAKKIQSWLFIAETCMIKDALACLTLLSLYMQSNSSSVIDAYGHIESLSTKLLAMKEANGKCLMKFVDSYCIDGCYKNVQILKNDSDELKFQTLRSEFFQAIHDNIARRFPPTKFMQAASVLDKASWPCDLLKRALFGESEIVYLCKQFNIASNESAEILMAFSLFKQGQGMNAHLNSFMQLLKVLPVSTAACERGFSQMNLHHTMQIII